MYEKHQLDIISFDNIDVFVDNNTPSYGGDGGWDLFSVDEKSDI